MIYSNVIITMQSNVRIMALNYGWQCFCWCMAYFVDDETGADVSKQQWISEQNEKQKLSLVEQVHSHFSYISKIQRIC